MKRPSAMRPAYLNPKLTIVFEDRRMEEPERIVYHEPTVSSVLSKT